MSVNWGQGPDFGEVAETLGIPTDQIVGMASPSREAYTVLYSPRPYDPEDENPPVCAQGMRRDASGILVKFGPAVNVPDYWKKVRESIDDALGGEQ